ncbi:hypothetical protein SXCC_04774 [Gluconacetobacter sp. SXCC-1]|nr:hypothetical protein SXCC_04774 [Gluconacetobacter sp. SXCC-1]
MAKAQVPVARSRADPAKVFSPGNHVTRSLPKPYFHAARSCGR